MGEEPGKKHEEFICSRPCHISAVLCTLGDRSEQQGNDLPKTSHDDLESWELPSLLGCAVLYRSSKKSHQFFPAEIT
jgi:hypothetical protein